jgi:hypothetical protein
MALALCANVGRRRHQHLSGGQQQYIGGGKQRAAAGVGAISTRAWRSATL